MNVSFKSKKSKVKPLQLWNSLHEGGEVAPEARANLTLCETCCCERRGKEQRHRSKNAN